MHRGSNGDRSRHGTLKARFEERGARDKGKGVGVKKQKARSKKV